MSTSAALLLVSTSLYAGFQATIRVVVYPQFTGVPGPAFTSYERAHQRRVTFVVGPLFVFAAASSIAAFAIRPGLPTAVAAACCGLIVAVTGLAAVPLHRRLSDGFEATAHRRLLVVDSVRLALAVTAVAAALAYAL